MGYLLVEISSPTELGGKLNDSVRNQVGNIIGGGRCPVFQVTQHYIWLITTIMYLLIAIRQDIIIQYHGNYIEVKIFNYMLENDMSRKIFLGNF